MPIREVERALERLYEQSIGPPKPRASVAPWSHGPIEPAHAVGFADGSPFTWPALVLALEASHGRRLQRLAEQIAAAGVERNFKTVLFTSVYRAEGRTTLVLAVARALARLPGKTVLVDADLTAPTLSRALALVPRPGLEDAVEGGEPLDKVLVESSQEHLVVLTLRAPVAHPKRFLANPQWACLMARLRREFDSVLLDGGPLFSGLSATVLHRPVDAAVLVFHRSLTSERAMRRASQALEAAGIPLFGLAETFTD